MFGKQPRYYIEPGQHRYVGIDSEFKCGKLDLWDLTTEDKIYVNILDKHSSYIHVKMFLPAGQVQNAYLPIFWDDIIQIDGMDLLLDGRFNL